MNNSLNSLLSVLIILGSLLLLVMLVGYAFGFGFSLACAGVCHGL